MSAEKSDSEKVDVVKEEYAPRNDSDNLSINEAARGDNLPDNYFMSFSFLGALAVSILYAGLGV